MKHRKARTYVISVLLALGATLVAFGVAYAGVVQWSRDQGAVVTIASAGVLAPESVKLCEDSECLNELTAAERIQFEVAVFKPPLDRLLGSGFGSKQIWVQNNAEIPLTVVSFDQWIRDPDSGETLLVLSVSGPHVCGEEGCIFTPIAPGEIQGISVSVSNIQPSAAEKEIIEFSAVIAAIGDTAGGAASEAAINSILEEAASKAEENK